MSGNKIAVVKPFQGFAKLFLVGTNINIFSSKDAALKLSLNFMLLGAIFIYELCLAHPHFYLRQIIIFSSTPPYSSCLLLTPACLDSLPIAKQNKALKHHRLPLAKLFIVNGLFP